MIYIYGLGMQHNQHRSEMHGYLNLSNTISMTCMYVFTILTLATKQPVHETHEHYIILRRDVYKSETINFEKDVYICFYQNSDM